MRHTDILKRLVTCFLASLLLALAPTVLHAQPGDADWKNLRSALSSRIDSNNGIPDAQSMEMAQQLIVMAEQVYGPDSQETAFSHFNLYYMHAVQKEFPQAAVALTQAVEIQEKLHRPSDPTLGFYLSHLGDAYVMQRAWPQAAAQYERAVAVKEVELGPEAAGLMQPLHDLANSAHMANDSKKAQAALLRALHLADLHKSQFYLKTLSQAAHVLAKSFLQRGDAASAAVLLEQEVHALEMSGEDVDEALGEARSLLQQARKKAGIEVTSVSAPPTVKRLSAQECKAIEEKLASSASPAPASASIITRTETVMFMTKAGMEAVDGGCPALTLEPRKKYQEAYAAAEQACNAIQAGGQRCAPRNHFDGKASANPPPPVPAPAAPAEPIRPTFKCDLGQDVHQAKERGLEVLGYDPSDGLYFCRAAQDTGKAAPKADERQCGRICTAN